MDHDHPVEQHSPSVQTPAPIAGTQRLKSLDALRGFALMGILMPNIISFGWPSSAMKDVAIMSETTANQLGYDITNFFFMSKFRFLFATLFGAGVIVYARKFDRPDDPLYKSKLSSGASLWYIRCTILLVFGLIHAYCFWYGDILTWYALAGLTLLWWIRKIPIKLQLLLAIVSYTLGIMFMLGLTWLQVLAYKEGSVSDDQIFGGSPQTEIAGYTGTWFDAFRTRFFTAFFIHLILVPIYIPVLWGIMTFGMVLMRSKLLAGIKSTRWYFTAAAICLTVGFSTTYIWFQWHAQATNPAEIMFRSILVEPAGIPLALGYASLVIALSKLVSMNWLTTPLAAVGKMALTNYFLHTLLCTTFFYGYGFGYFAQIQYPQLFLMVIAVWSINIIFSMLWLKLFTMGPVEWFWRVLTYRQIVPILRDLRTPST